MVGTMVEDFAAEIQALLKRENFVFPNEQGELVVPNVYAHALPPAPHPQRNPALLVAKGEKLPKANRVPWVLVLLYSGEQVSGDDSMSVTLHITDMVYDATENMQGGRDALELIGVICRNLYSNTFVADRYEVRYPYQFAVLDDIKYPYFSAGLAIKVQLPGIAPQNKIGGYAYV